MFAYAIRRPAFGRRIAANAYRTARSEISSDLRTFTLTYLGTTAFLLTFLL